MSISTRANKLDGVEQAFVAMATEMNKGVLKNLGLLTPELEEAKSGDLMIVIKGTSEEANERTLIAIDELFAHKEQGGQHEARYATIASAKKHAPESNLAVISSMACLLLVKLVRHYKITSMLCCFLTTSLLRTSWNSSIWHMKKGC